MKKNIDFDYIKSELKKIQKYFLAQKFEKVIEKTTNLMKKSPNQVPYYNYIGLSHRQLGRNHDAETIFKKGLEIFPDNLTIICNLGALYRLMARFEEADYFLKKGLEIKEDDFNTLCNYGNLKRDINQNKEAIKYYKKAYKINNHNETLLINLAGAYQIDAEFEQSKKILTEIHANFPRNTKADFMYSSVHNYQENDNHRNEMINKLNLDLQDQDIVYLNFAIAKSYSDIKNYSESSGYFIKANKSQYNLFTNYKFKDELDKFSIIKNKFENFKFTDLCSNKKPNLIFIVGLPRSGTTLTHQIISSHSEVYGAGELPIISNIFNNKIKDDLFLDKIFRDDDYHNNTFVREFAKKVEKIFNQFDSKIILDKLPLNFMWVGFIKLLFPQAKIIHCKRNLRDVGLSIYRNYFDGGHLPWSYNDETLVQFIKAYDDLMNFWNNKLSNQIYNCEYENLVDNQLDETKKIINFCNLDWQDSCIDYTKNDTGIKTVSISQARKPIYKSSIKLSDNYLEYLAFLNKI
ncbi:sulfotransferase [Pelagibacterales bacterium SAG-MED49]|nr:sulfotransferase [Pelagibacterales bacterium SAG-MED49]